ncbi:hypothetical protein DPMN_060044 [Dreissena polymorpha]|uniref:Uncharacterized protein n=1 Tax=Dreissena polymorpha TaxID=45954 RepID=A0A9D4C506_DREPO|nr:hypothetical protein DPMN_060044 [Dreissena polymorpha]
MLLHYHCPQAQVRHLHHEQLMVLDHQQLMLNHKHCPLLPFQCLPQRLMKQLIQIQRTVQLCLLKLFQQRKQMQKVLQALH